MQVKQFCDTAEKLARDYKTKYQLGGWGQQENGYYLFDCVCLIKSILWGFNFSKGGHGGAIYESNGVPDLGANDFFEQCCYDFSNDFTKIEIGELVWMNGHIGIYIGEGYLNIKGARYVAEATSAWANKVLLSDLGTKGQRSSNGKQVGKWTQHAKCQFIEYVDYKQLYEKELLVNKDLKNQIDYLQTKIDKAINDLK